MPRRSGIEAGLAIKELVPSTKIVMLTISDEGRDLYDAVRPAPMVTCSRTCPPRRSPMVFGLPTRGSR